MSLFKRPRSSTEQAYGSARLLHRRGMRHVPNMARDQDGLRVLARARGRLMLVALAFGTCFFAVGLRLSELGLANPGISFATHQAVKAAENPAPRGDILDRNGILLARSGMVPSVFINPKLVIDAQETVTQLHSVFPHLDTERLARSLAISGSEFTWVMRKISPREKQAVLQLGLPGIGFRHEPQRLYPQGANMVHILGLTNSDDQGIEGLELSLNSVLNRGEDQQLSIDIRLQSRLRQTLAGVIEKHSAKAANALVMDVQTGEILAMVSLPDYDPMTDRAARKGVAGFNRNSMGVYEIGSIFKIFNTALVLEQGIMELHEGFDTRDEIRIGRFRIRDYRPQNRFLDVADIFKYSSNIGSARMAMAAGADLQRDFLSRLNLLGTVTTELPEQPAPHLPPQWGQATTMTVSFGHGISVTPIQATAAVASLVNGGHWLQPSLLAGGVSQGATPAVISPQTARSIRALMRLSVLEGTSTKAEAKGYFVGAKTGTAEKVENGDYVEGKLVSSVLGIFPAYAPRYAVLVMVDEPQPIRETFGFATGGWVAAPVMAEVTQQIAALYALPPMHMKDAEILAPLSYRDAEAVLAAMPEQEGGQALASQ